jgi:myo-inositol-1(or 4)-monophosphatase
VLEAGAIYAPMLGELYAGRRGGGATLNGKSISVSTVSAVADAFVATGFVPSRYERNMANFDKLSAVSQAVRRDGSAALDIAFVAAGRFEAFWEWDLKPWDVAAGAVIVAAAGGTITAIAGSPLDISAGSVLASNGAVHEEMKSLLV